MLVVELASQPRKFLRRAERKLVKRLIARIERMAFNPFPPDAKRVVNRKEKVFRIRVGNYRIEYFVVHKLNRLYITSIKKKPRAY